MPSNSTDATDSPVQHRTQPALAVKRGESTANGVRPAIMMVMAARSVGSPTPSVMMAMQAGC
jgi:hypothetical protein|tara:strand:+ start:509 stop:694 length:186 start_codon:yes stop_codon:yes gene_type:complete